MKYDYLEEWREKERVAHAAMLDRLPTVAGSIPNGCKRAIRKAKIGTRRMTQVYCTTHGDQVFEVETRILNKSPRWYEGWEGENWITHGIRHDITTDGGTNGD